MVKRKRKRKSARSWSETDDRKFEPTVVAIPDSVQSFEPEPGVYKLDFMLYICGKGNPAEEEGDTHFERTFYTHYVGKNFVKYVCPYRTWKKPCPICEYRSKLALEGADKKQLKPMNTSTRQLWLVRDLNDHDTDDFKIWNISQHCFGATLKSMIRTSEKADEYEFFADPIDGKTLRVALDEQVIDDPDSPKKPTPFVKTSSIEFRPRRDDYDEELIDDMPCLDDLLIETSYDKLKSLFFEIEEEDIEEEEKPRARRRRDDDEEEEEKPRARRRRDDDEEEEEKPKRRRRRDDDEEEEEKPRARRRRDDDEEEEKPQVKRRRRRDDDEEEEEEEKPKRRRRRDDDEEEEKPQVKRRRRRDDDEDDDDDDIEPWDQDDEDDEPKRRRARAVKSDDDGDGDWK